MEMECVKSNFVRFKLSVRPNSIEDTDFIMIGVGGFIHSLNHQNKQTINYIICLHLCEN